MDTFVTSSLGIVVMTLWQRLFPAPSWHPFTCLACGWTRATDRPTITTSLWLTGATTVKHFSPGSVFLGCPLSTKRGPRWGAVIRRAAQFLPAGEVIRVLFADATKQKAGPQIEGLARYRQGAGSARHASHTRRGVHCVLGRRRVPLTRWPGPRRSVPVGRALSRQPEHAHQRHVPYRSSSQWARNRRDGIAAQLPARPLRALADGGYATKDDGRDGPTAAPLVGRFPLRATRYQVPPTPTSKRRGAPRKKGAGMGSPTTLAQASTDWAPHPSDAGAERHAWGGLWPAGWPGRLIRVVVVRRAGTRGLKPPGHSPPATCRGLLHDRAPLEPPGHLGRVPPALGGGK